MLAVVIFVRWNPSLHVGLGKEAIKQIEIIWPDGTTKILENTDINQEISVDFPM